MKIVNFLLLTFIGLLAACSSDVPNSEIKDNTQVRTVPESDVEPEINSFIVNGKDTLYRVDGFNKNVFWELKYATTDNFMHRILYDTLKAVYVQKEVAERLGKIQDYMDRRYEGMHLLVYDGARPLAVQQEMWDALDSIPPLLRGKFVSNPKNGSVHNYGAAVDITICEANKKPLDMGAKYDEIRSIAYPSLETHFLASGELSKEQVDNRKLLRKLMRNQGFINIPTEWWHFNAYPRVVAKRIYEIVNREY